MFVFTSLADTYWQFAIVDGTLAGSQPTGPVAQRVMPAQELGLSRRVGKSSRESAGRNRWSGITHRPSPVAELSRIASRWYRRSLQAYHPQGGPKQTNGAQLRNRKVSSSWHATWRKLPADFLFPLPTNHSFHVPLRCVSLQELILTENFLTELPTSVGNLSRLTNLNVDRNRLFELPIEIGQLVSLNVLSLRENKLTLLPQELGDCAELHVLDVSGNR